ncbi:hypothetical protein ACLRGI_03855 [Paenarthrobacter nitroguajacolicus]|uniref:hypothetical protein n=1 Tax=Paenarthrobacter nitroguajacolicus TaxID=211146 RepID=UPI003ADB8953
MIGTEVEIRHQGILVRLGIVDAAMPDASIIWLTADHKSPRTLYEAYEARHS